MTHVDSPVIKSKSLCAAETLDMIGLEPHKNKRERKILSKILGSKMNDRNVKQRPNKELFSKKRRLTNILFHYRTFY